MISRELHTNFMTAVVFINGYAGVDRSVKKQCISRELCPAPVPASFTAL